MNIGDYYKHIATNMIGRISYVSKDNTEIDIKFEAEDLDGRILEFSTFVNKVALDTHYIKVSSLEKELL